jgi:hypothetical protein
MQHPCFHQNSLPCDCTYSTPALAYDATAVMTKVGEDFPFRAFNGIGGVVVTQNADTIDIDGSNIAGGSLQSAYDGGNTILTAGGLPVDIEANNMPALNIHDAGPTGLFSVTSTAPGDADIVLSNASGLTLNSPVQLLAPTTLDPLSNIFVAHTPTAVNNLSTITSVANPLLSAPANYVYSYIAPSANTVNHVRLHAVGVTAANESFSIEATVKFAPSGATPIIAISNSVAADLPLGGITIDYTFAGSQLNFVLIDNLGPITARVQSLVMATVLTI